MTRGIRSIVRSGAARPRRRVRRASAALLLLGWTGCASLDVVTPEHLNGQQLVEEGTAVAHIAAATWGVYLFKSIPLATGNTENPGRVRWPVFFRNDVRLEVVVEMVTKKSRELGATRVTDLQSVDKSEWMNWSLLLWLNEIEVTANASR